MLGTATLSPSTTFSPAAEIRIASTSVFESSAIVSYLKGKAADTGARIKSAISKVFGLYDATEGVIHIDNTVVEAKQTFLKLHETGASQYAHTPQDLSLL